MKRKAESAAKREARARFNEEVLSAGYCVEHGTACAEAGEIQDPHHIVKAQTIRFHLLPLRLDDDELWPIVFDPRIGCVACRPFHELIDGKTTRDGERVFLRPEQVNYRALAFCFEHGLTGKLEQAVPGILAELGVHQPLNDD